MGWLAEAHRDLNGGPSFACPRSDVKCADRSGTLSVMTTAGKLTPEEQGQLLLDLAAEAEIERIRDMTTEEVRALARKRGVNLEVADQDFDRLMASFKRGDGAGKGGSGSTSGP
jgi:hypothetical protein